MASINKVILIGNLGRDPEVRFTTGGTAVGDLAIATNEVWTDKSGQRQEKTEWHKVVVWGKQAEQCRDYLAKGRSVYIEGRLQTRQWDDKDGNKRFTTEIVAQVVRFLDRREGGGDVPSGGSRSGHTAPSGGSRPSQQGTRPEGPPPHDDDDNLTDDDIPF